MPGWKVRAPAGRRRGRNVRNPNPSPVYQFPAVLSVPGHVIVSGPTWTRPSRSRADQGLEHAVSIDPATGLFECTCESNRYRHVDCPHIIDVQQGRAGKPRYEVMPLVATVKATPKPVVSTDSFDASDLYGDGGQSATAAVAAWRQAS